MIIHVVRAGDSLYSISRRYGVPVERIASDNELNVSESLVIGQTIVVMEGTRRHTVRAGESLYSIARQYGTTVAGIQAANQIANPAMIRPGMVLTIPSGTDKLGTIDVNGYAFPNISMDVLRKTLPYLTYLSIFSYEVKPDGSFRPINDEPLIAAARAANVAPLMVITNLREGGGFDSDLAKTILTNEQVQDTLINNVIENLRAKNYTGLDIDFEYVYPENREDYNNFLRKVSSGLRPLGYSITTALAPKIAADQPGLLYEAHDYPVHGALVDHVILMTYEWGYTFGPPMAVAPINEVRKVINYAMSAIPRRKILMGIPNYGYDWVLPYVEGSRATTISNVGAVDLARREGAAIQYDQTAQAPFFNYYDDNGRQHVVWFDDARSMEARLRLVNQYNLGGVSYWTIGRFFPQNWLVLSSLYDVRKVL
ncbi:MAG TPA: LysM peptidoglycan-binding domain-containing protein [Bacillota bacterium]|nr:LysM peptidoglycan-binding domain-containing protein [Clostridiaceae bacterium]HNT04392.1 LysM peptidoglycan-binding domain-containing protein [Bacillota bacterium]HPA55150.1 LysM peptidoglycan-binding domain-containing protein [Bacillota bacterium]HPX69990.1 LysM peptidoglycan-binding domain-containing protein [Bacillota bacterium]HQA64573.1 LysM peptidoglycan-binding domain-containing protein [Bacillota bacterium]